MSKKSDRAAAVQAAMSAPFADDEMTAAGIPTVDAVNARMEDGADPVTADERTAAWDARPAEDAPAPEAPQTEQPASEVTNSTKVVMPDETAPLHHETGDDVKAEVLPAPVLQAMTDEPQSAEQVRTDPDGEKAKAATDAQAKSDAAADAEPVVLQAMTDEPDTPETIGRALENADLEGKVTINISAAASNPVYVYIHGRSTITIQHNVDTVIPRVALDALRDSDVTFTEVEG